MHEKEVVLECETGCGNTSFWGVDLACAWADACNLNIETNVSVHGCVATVCTIVSTNFTQKTSLNNGIQQNIKLQKKHVTIAIQ